MAANEELTARIQAGETEAIAELWEQNLKLVKSTVRRVSGLSERDSGFDDLEQQAFFGFRAAAYAFDPAAGVKFSTYAAKRIEWELCRYYEQNGYTVRLPAYMRRRIRDCLEQKRRMEAAVGHSVSYAAALEALHLPPAVAAGMLAAFSRLETMSLDTETGSSILDMLASETETAEVVIGQEWHRELHELLIKALEDIPEDVRGIIRRHYFGGVSIARMAADAILPGERCFPGDPGEEVRRRALRVPSLHELQGQSRQADPARGIGAAGTVTRGKGDVGIMTLYQNRREMLLSLLETYRDTAPEAWRRYMDGLIETSRRAAGNDPDEKRYHNLIVLRYIAGKSPAMLRICKALHISRANYDSITGQAIDQLLALAFGTDGIPWEL